MMTLIAQATSAHAPHAMPLTVVDLSIAAALVLIAGIVSVSLRLRLEKQLAIASVRTVVQLLAIGYVLGYVFKSASAWLVIAVVALMIGAASIAAVKRANRRIRAGAMLAFVALVLSGLTTTLIVTDVVIGVEPWYKPQYLIPLLGMVLGNGLTGISLCLDTLLEALAEKRDLIEMELAHGATRWEAARDPVRDAVRRGMIPIINSMMVVGIVSLPGMMTGQILENANPIDAVRYQIVVMFMIAAATSGGCMLIALMVFHRVFNARHQLRAEVIHKR